MEALSAEQKKKTDKLFIKFTTQIVLKAIVVIIPNVALFKTTIWKAFNCNLTFLTSF